MKIILVHNPFELLKPRTWLALIIRLVTNSNWNHCAAIVEIEGEEMVSDFQTHSKVRTYQEWLLEDNQRTFVVVEKESKMSDSWIRSQVICSSGRYKGYEYAKLVNHLTYIKKRFTLFKENPDRFVCSEWVWFLLTGEKVNWAVPNYFVTKEQLNINKS